MSPNQHVDVAIVGGGVVGVAVAYFLAQRGLEPLVIEGTDVAHGASGKSAGLLSPGLPHDDDETGVLPPLIARSVSLHGALAELLDGPATYDYTPYTTCLVAQDEDEAAHLHARAEHLHAEPIPPAEIAERCPWLDQPVAGALAQPTAQIDSAKFTERLLESAKSMGTSLRMGRAVGLVGGEDYVDGIELSDGFVTAEATVLAMGPWSMRAAAWLDLPIPVRPLKGQIVHLEPSVEPPPGGFSDMRGHYVVTRPTGLVHVGATEEEEGFDAEPTAAAREYVLSTLARFTSRLRDMQPVNQTACLRPSRATGCPSSGRRRGGAGRTSPRATGARGSSSRSRPARRWPS